MIYEPLPHLCIECHEEPTHKAAMCRDCYQKASECSSCAGEGYFTRWHRHDWFGAVDSDVRCDDCDGTGIKEEYRQEGGGNTPSPIPTPLPAPKAAPRRVSWVEIEHAPYGSYSIIAVSRKGAKTRKYKMHEVSASSISRVQAMVGKMNPYVEVDEDLTISVRFYAPESL